ncbi:hypothetical protein RJG79_04990 [Mycoplasmatota bacterium WC44]
MSLPKNPNSNRAIFLREKHIKNLLLSSIALEQIAIAKILKAEGDKITMVIDKNSSITDILDVNESVEKIVNASVKKGILLEYKMDDVLIEVYFDDCNEEE